MSEWEPLAGETPIDPSGLRHQGSITNRRELAAAEALNINRAFLKYLAAKPSSRSATFEFAWFLKLHREMFGEVWEEGARHLLPERRCRKKVPGTVFWK